jgi:tripartite-type tricarboxylate transporter receptor subunit TctC
MRHNGKPIFLLATLFISIVFLASMWDTAHAQTYPKKPIDLIVPHAPGAATDAGARIIAPYLAAKWGVPVNVVNKPGGNGIPGALDVMKSEPDGLTMLMDGHSTNTMLAAAVKNLPVELGMRTPVVKVLMVPVFYIVRTSVPWKTLAEVIEEARKNPATFKWGAGTLGSIDNFSQTRLFEVAKIDPGAGRVIFDQGHAQALAALLGGHIQFGIGMMPDIKSLYPSKIRAFAVTAPERIQAFPEIPTTKEAGFAEANVVGWYGVSGPPKLPEAIINVWEKTLAEAVHDPQFQERAGKIGHLMRFVGHKDMQVELEKEYKVYLGIAERTGLRQ